MKDEVKVACPACGKPTLTRAGADEVCPMCGWQDDPRQRQDPSLPTGEGGITLGEARANVSAYGQAFPPSEAGV